MHGLRDRRISEHEFGCVPLVRAMGCESLAWCTYLTLLIILLGRLMIYTQSAGPTIKKVSYGVGLIGLVVSATLYLHVSNPNKAHPLGIIDLTILHQGCRKVPLRPIPPQLPSPAGQHLRPLGNMAVSNPPAPFLCQPPSFLCHAHSLKIVRVSLASLRSALSSPRLSLSSTT